MLLFFTRRYKRDKKDAVVVYSLAFLSRHPPFTLRSHSPITPLLTLDKVQLCQEFEFFGDVQLEVSEGRVGSQSEMLEILDGGAEPGAGQKQGEGC